LHGRLHAAASELEHFHYIRRDARHRYRLDGGKRPGDFIADQAMEVAKDTALAMSMFIPLGGGGGAGNDPLQRTP
jgi:hypothetical protein